MFVFVSYDHLHVSTDKFWRVQIHVPQVQDPRWRTGAVQRHAVVVAVGIECVVGVGHAVVVAVGVGQHSQALKCSQGVQLHCVISDTLKIISI